MKYLYNDQTFEKRSEVIKAASNNPDAKIRLIHQDVTFDDYNWRVEPFQSIDDLYANQAQKLRDLYDYLILFYSGGSDSHQVLCSFLDNNIHLDEVWTFYATKMIRKAADNPDKNPLQLLIEYEQTTAPRLHKYSISHPKTVYKKWDYSDYLADNFKNDNFLVSQEESLMYAQLFHTIRMHYQTICAQRYIDNYLSNKRVGIIYGIEKPEIGRINDRILISFGEFGIVDFLTRSPKHKLNFEVIRFFWDNPDIVCKQAHIIKKVLQKNKDFNRIFSTKNYHLFIKDSVFLKRLIYPTSFEPGFQQKIKNLNDDEIFEIYFDNPIKKVPILSSGGITLKTGKKIFRTKFHDIGNISPI